MVYCFNDNSTSLLNLSSEYFNDAKISILSYLFINRFLGSGWLKIKPEYVDGLSDEVCFVFLFEWGLLTFMQIFKCRKCHLKSSSLIYWSIFSKHVAVNRFLLTFLARIVSWKMHFIDPYMKRRFRYSDYCFIRKNSQNGAWD